MHRAASKQVATFKVSGYRVSSDRKAGKKKKSAATTGSSAARSGRSSGVSRKTVKTPSSQLQAASVSASVSNPCSDSKRPDDSAAASSRKISGEKKPTPSRANAAATPAVNSSQVDEEVITYAELRQRLQGEFSDDGLEIIDLAYEVAERSHEGQTRQSGLPYITHPLAVAAIAFEMKLDYSSIAAALLHDVLEDTSTDKAALQSSFGNEITEIVDGLSKLNKTEFRTREQAQAESLRKMLLAMVSDMRVILIKLADRLHNMRTLGSLVAEKKRRIARETLEVYAPIANRLGLNNIKVELEELGFAALNPRRKVLLEAIIAKAQKDNSYAMRQLITRIEQNLDDMSIKAQVFGRQKSAYSFYRKKKEKQVQFGEILDIFALRIIVDTVDECYRALGVVHHLYLPTPFRFKDFIAVPKENGYQSLHTVCQSEQGVPIEVQIRTRSMDQLAESADAAHWIYKDGEANAAEHRARNWMSGLLELHKSTSDSHEFIDQVKVDLFPRDVFVFTPKRKIIQLQSKSTPVDFAFAVHSQVGNRCVAAYVDNKLVPLGTELKSGQTVEIKTSSTSNPNPMWLNFVVTAKARSAIRHYLRNLDRKQARDFGERLLNRALSRYELDLEALPAKVLETLNSEFRFQSNDELYIDLGLGNHMPSRIAERLVNVLNGTEDLQSHRVDEIPPLYIEGEEGSVLSLATCCRPIPGDEVDGIITAGRGVVVHRSRCKNLGRMKRRREEWVHVAWPIETRGDYQSSILVLVKNHRGALARVSTVISGANCNIDGINFDNQGEDHINIQFIISVKDRQQVAKLIRRLRNLGTVDKVTRET